MIKNKVKKDKKNKTITEWTEINGIKDGLEIRWSMNGNKIHEMNYVNGEGEGGYIYGHKIDVNDNWVLDKIVEFEGEYTKRVRPNPQNRKDINEPKLGEDMELRKLDFE